MKKPYSWLFLAALVSIGLLLSGCRPASTAAAGETAAPRGSGANAQSLSLRLALGTLQLEETDLAVTPEQAAELLPLWKAAKNLGTSDNITTEEYDAIFEQIQETLTSAQMEAIQAQDPTGPALADLAQKYGLELPGNFGQGRFGNLTPEQRSTAVAARQSGGGGGGFQPGGGPEGGGGIAGGRFPGGEGGFTPPGGAGANNNGIQPSGQQASLVFGAVFYQAVIDLLQKKTQ